MTWNLKYAKNKYNNTPQLYNGMRYDSKKEAEYAKQLDLRVKAKDIKSWERQVKIDLRVNGKHITNYYVDFVITHNDKSREYAEVKGFSTDLFRLKWVLFEALLSEIDPGATMTMIK